MVWTADGRLQPSPEQRHTIVESKTTEIILSGILVVAKNPEHPIFLTPFFRRIVEPRAFFWFTVWQSRRGIEGRDGCADVFDCWMDGKIDGRPTPIWGPFFTVGCTTQSQVRHGATRDIHNATRFGVATFTRRTPPFHKMPTTTPTRTSFHHDDTAEEGSIIFSVIICFAMTQCILFRVIACFCNAHCKMRRPGRCLCHCAISIVIFAVLRICAFTMQFLPWDCKFYTARKVCLAVQKLHPLVMFGCILEQCLFTGAAKRRWLHLTR